MERTKRTRRRRNKALKRFQNEARSDAAAEFPTPTDAELIRLAIRDDASVYKSSKLTDAEREIIDQYAAMTTLAMVRGNFARARLAIDEAERLLNPPEEFDALKLTIDANKKLISAQVGILQAAGFYFWHQFVDKSQAELLEIPHVGKKTVDIIAAYMRSAKSPIPKKRKANKHRFVMSSGSYGRRNKP